MAAIYAWITANWMSIIVVALAVDRFLLQLFPTNTLFSSVLGVLQSLSGGASSAQIKK